MTFKEFLEYMENNLNNRDTFYKKALDDQIARNARRLAAKRWNEQKINRVIDRQWSDMMKNVYDKFKTNIKINPSNPFNSWIDYIERNDALESLDEMIVDLEFE